MDNETSRTAPQARDELIRTISQSMIDPEAASCNKGSPGSTYQARESVETQRDGIQRTTTTPSDMEAVRTVSTQGPLYSIFTPGQKRFIVFMSSTGGFFSAVSANIYFPALNALSLEFGVSATLINLTITTYMVLQGFVPLLVGDLADAVGRRPAYLLCIVVYIGANIGLALCPNYAALLVLRSLQSTGSSTLIALGSGVVADIADASERGLWMGITTAGPNVAQSLGPVIGGVISQFLGWRWIFWLLTILSATYFIPLLLLYPETSRNVVGNGSIPPQSWNVSLLSYLHTRRAASAEAHREKMLARTTDSSASHSVEEMAPASEHETSESGPSVRATTATPLPEAGEQQRANPKLRFPNPWHGIRLLGEKEIGLLLLFNAVIFICFYTPLAALPYLFAKIYHFNDLQVGLCFLPVGFGAVLAPIINGNILDWNFRRTAKKLGMVVNRKRATDLTSFPLEKARLQVLMPFVFSCVAVTLTYGWIMHIEAPLPAALVVQFFIGISTTASFGALNVLLVDLVPSSPTTVIAANNLCRCWLGAGAAAVIIPIIEGLGTGWAFTLTAGMLLACTPISYILIKKGPQWREERRVRLAEQDRRKEQKNKEKRDVRDRPRERDEKA
ncbi:Quinidine resistance protein 1 [Sphaceloma murrayae]|uniref:Quinidine resistance protein 1 n=1 Tax=Sphaceloma murrayae TaxID=2082308 RepID=A0A2K1QI70_9PEZI|nr:Quinidine resistance protein 1 [Sphaceloma murrayae]